MVLSTVPASPITSSQPGFSVDPVPPVPPPEVLSEVLPESVLDAPPVPPVPPSPPELLPVVFVTAAPVVELVVEPMEPGPRHKQ